MPEDESLECLEAQLTMVRWHLDALRPQASAANRRHLESARQALERASELLSRITVPGSRRVKLLAEVTALRARVQELMERS
jgi:hypothetical protein